MDKATKARTLELVDLQGKAMLAAVNLPVHTRAALLHLRGGREFLLALGDYERFLVATETQEPS